MAPAVLLHRDLMDLLRGPAAVLGNVDAGHVGDPHEGMVANGPAKASTRLQ